MQGVDPQKFTAFNVLEDDELRQGVSNGLPELWNRYGTEIKYSHRFTGIKEYSDWPTIPQLYVDKEFVGGCDILLSMHQDGSLAKLLEEKNVLVPSDIAETVSSNS